MNGSGSKPLPLSSPVHELLRNWMASLDEHPGEDHEPS